MSVCRIPIHYGLMSFQYESMISQILINITVEARKAPFICLCRQTYKHAHVGVQNNTTVKTFSRHPDEFGVGLPSSLTVKFQ